MYILIVKGARRATLAYHRTDSHEELHDLLAVYRALGYSDDALIVEERHDEEDRAA